MTNRNLFCLTFINSLNLICYNTIKTSIVWRDVYAKAIIIKFYYIEFYCFICSSYRYKYSCADPSIALNAYENYVFSDEYIKLDKTKMVSESYEASKNKPDIVEYKKSKVHYGTKARFSTGGSFYLS